MFHNGGGVIVQERPARRVAIAEHIQETPNTRLRGLEYEEVKVNYGGVICRGVIMEKVSYGK